MGRHPGTVGEMGTRLGKWAEMPTLSTFSILGPLLDFYKTYRTRVVERRSNFFSTTRILREREIPSF